jgi:hypothetical protein
MSKYEPSFLILRMKVFYCLRKNLQVVKTLFCFINPIKNTEDLNKYPIFITPYMKIKTHTPSKWHIISIKKG